MRLKKRINKRQVKSPMKTTIMHDHNRYMTVQNPATLPSTRVAHVDFSWSPVLMLFQLQSLDLRP